jgi:hypothetical protein
MNNVGQRRHRYAGTRDKAHSPRACAQAATFSSDTPVASRFETRRMAQAYSRADEKRLKKGRKAERNHARDLRRCRLQLSNPCGRASCRVCGLKFRRSIWNQLVRLADSTAVIITINLSELGPSALKSTNLDSIKDKLRTRFERASLRGALIAGGIEAEWNAAESIWRLHAHLVVIGVTPERIDNLRSTSSSSPDRALKVQALRDAERQLSYLLKFVTYFRPRRQTGPSRSRAVPLPNARFFELAAWRKRYRPRDFLFLYGARLGAGDRIWLLPHARPRAHGP